METCVAVAVAGRYETEGGLQARMVVSDSVQRLVFDLRQQLDTDDYSSA